MPTIAVRQVNPDVRVCLTEDSGVLMDVQRDRIYSLDRVGAVIWRLLGAGETPDAIARSVSVAEDVPVAMVQNDVARFLDRLDQMGLLVQGETGAAATPTETSDLREPITQTLPAPGSRGLVMRSLWWLLRIDLKLRLRGFSHLYRSVAEHPRRAIAAADGTVAAVCRALDHACTLYPRQALCLQRAAAAVCLLRNHGVPARLVVGARKHPFRAHAWVEVDGIVVNDKRGVTSYYHELDRI